MDTRVRDFPAGSTRTSDAERDRALAELSEHFQTGRLTQEEFEDRSGRALRAVTGDDLNALFADLPAGPVAPIALEVPGAGRAPERRFGAPVVLLAVVAVLAVGGFCGLHVFGWLVPLLVVAFIVRRLARR